MLRRVKDEGSELVNRGGLLVHTLPPSERFLYRGVPVAAALTRAVRDLHSRASQPEGVNAILRQSFLPWWKLPELIELARVFCKFYVLNNIALSENF